MLAKIKSVRGALIMVVLALLCGCTPAGPRALVKGKRCLDRGEMGAAVIQFQRATGLLPANAGAWNYLGVACQRAGRLDEAVNAYATALRLDHNLAEVHFNLGVLWLEQNRPDLAQSELTAYTLRRPNDAKGWLKLGFAQLRAGDLALAERSFATVRALKGDEAEAFNGLGLSRLQAGKFRDAAQFFGAAVQTRPDFAAALQNLATVELQYLHDDKAALAAFQTYLNLVPRPANYNEVRSLVASLAPAEVPPVVPPAPVTMRTSAPPAEPRPKTVGPPLHPPSGERPAGEAAPAVHPPARPATAPSGSGAVVPTTPVRGRSEPVNVPAPKTNHPSRPISGVDTLPRVVATPLVVTTTTVPISTPGGAGGAAPELAANPAAPPPAITGPRYAYLSPAKPPPGDRQSAQGSFAKAQDAERDENSEEAERWYQQAADADPAWFEAQYNAAVVAQQLHHYSTALRRYELALALQPDSVDTRYNFASVLRSAGYPLAAAEQLKRILTAEPNEVRAHLALGTLYAHSLDDPVQARQHYLRVLALQPDNPRATEIRFWLSAHPESKKIP
jgi:Flp pilus assembly protein TadD